MALFPDRPPSEADRIYSGTVVRSVDEPSEIQSDGVQIGAHTAMILIKCPQTSAHCGTHESPSAATL
jgi:hypothetical protein